MENIALLYVQKLIEDLMESSSSSDEDEEIAAVLTRLRGKRPKVNFMGSELNGIKKQRTTENNGDKETERNQHHGRNSKVCENMVVLTKKNSNKNEEFFDYETEDTNDETKDSNEDLEECSEGSECSNADFSEQEIDVGDVRIQTEFVVLEGANDDTKDSNENIEDSSEDSDHSNPDFQEQQINEGDHNIETELLILNEGEGSKDFEGFDELDGKELQNDDNTQRVEEIGEDRKFETENKVMNEFSESQFKENFHICRTTAIYLMERYSLWYFKMPYQESQQKSIIEADVLSFIWFCTNDSNYHEVAKMFKTKISNVCKSFDRVLRFLIDKLAAEIIKFPNSDEEKKAMAEDFKHVAGFPNVLGCVAEIYFSAKNSSNVHFRGVCDSKLRFLNVKIGGPNDIVDTFIEKDLPQLCSPKYHLLGDSKCPIREFLITPFDNDGNLSEAEKNFNIKLMRTHVKINNAFGSLRSRFEKLKSLDFKDIKTTSEFIMGCCVLHNICIDRSDDYGFEMYANLSNRRYKFFLTSIKNDEFLSDLGLMKRFELKHLLFKTT